jgi:hypothetical protein
MIYFVVVVVVVVVGTMDCRVETNRIKRKEGCQGIPIRFNRTKKKQARDGLVFALSSLVDTTTKTAKKLDGFSRHRQHERLGFRSRTIDDTRESSSSSFLLLFVFTVCIRTSGCSPFLALFQASGTGFECRRRICRHDVVVVVVVVACSIIIRSQ